MKMKTLVQGKEEKWTPEIHAKWKKAMSIFPDRDDVSESNYFTPRPYNNEYDTGSKEEGFTYVLKRNVCQVIISRLSRINNKP